MDLAGVAMFQLQQTYVPRRRLGRHVHHDPRSRDFAAPRANRLVNVKHNLGGLPLDQREQDCCTAHALCSAISIARPSSVRSRPLELIVPAVHRTAHSFEEGIAPYAGFGHSALTVCKAAMRLGLIMGYTHAFGIEHALQALVLSPLMTGFTWYSSFHFPDPATGMVKIASGARARGGHEVVADEIDVDNQLVWFYNSWGPDFGREGRFCMSFTTWAYLLGDSGDVTLPVPDAATNRVAP
jgi:hypothetical protein